MHPLKIKWFPFLSCSPATEVLHQLHTYTKNMKITYLKRSFFFRRVLAKGWPKYSEVETNVMIGIYLMNNSFERCSCNTLFAYLSKVHRTPYKKTLLATLRKFKQEGIIRVSCKGPGTKIHLTMEGTLYLIRLEEKLRRVRFIN